MNDLSKIVIFILPVYLILAFCIKWDFSGMMYMNEGNDEIDFEYNGQSIVQQATVYKFIGAEKCGLSCHNTDSMGRQYDQWKRGPHAQAFTVLSSRKALKISGKNGLSDDPMEEQACLKCHLTGSGLDSSYFAATYRKEDGVTCEACHKRISDGKTILPDENDCKECHNTSIHVIKKFVAGRDMAKISHPRPLKQEQVD